ncbi:hypothetical protein [Paraburkholderia sp. MM6662-R1]|uniref:hypothetical protein n=1 Tax=Paraburkholderia sp. MM6662-R1 TaxID=2991066 RepID=UPI003D223696
MADTRSPSGSRMPVLFLKATTRRVFVQTFTRPDGAVVRGHYTTVRHADERAEPSRAASAPATVDDHLGQINAARLHQSNVNARVVNMKLDAIAAALKAGDPAVLTMMSYGTNNYAKKAVALANRALEVLGSSDRVQLGQKGTPGFRTDAQIAAAKARAKAARTVDPEHDSLFTAIAKLGGLNAADVKKAWGFGKNDLKGYAVGIKPVFSSSKGRTIEQMAEALHELGYLNSEDHTELEEHVSNGMAGSEHFTPQGYANKAQVDYDEQYQGLTAQDAHETGFDDLPPAAQDHIEEFLDENPNFTADELESFGRTLELDDSDVPFDLDFGTAGGRHYDFGQAHAAPRKGGEPGADVPF